MPTTSKMGIVYPSSSDLVKDGATNMGTIATTVDAKTGLVFLKSTSFSGVSSFSLDAASFTSNFENYRLLVSVSSSTGNTEIRSRLRISGTDNSTNNYSYQGIKAVNAGALANDGSASFNYWKHAENYASFADFMYIGMDLFQPFASATTKFNSSTFGHTTTGAYCGFTYSGAFAATTSFDSISFITSTGNISGKVVVYGYNA